MSYTDDNVASGRILLPDLVRAFALIGIALVNVAYFAYPADITYHAGGLHHVIDHAVYFSVNSLFLFKSYTLFSFMFGVGIAYQMNSAQRRGESFGAAYGRRMAGLILLGVLHVTFGFLGDILIVYGVLGAILFYFRNSTQKTLIRVGMVLVVLQLLVSCLFAAGLYLSETQAPEQWALAIAEMEVNRDAAQSIYSQGSLGDVAGRRWLDWLGMMKFAMPLQAPGALGFFLFGLAAVRAGVLNDPDAALWVSARRWYLPIGVVLSMLGALVYMQSDHPISAVALLGYALLLFAAPFSSLGYIGLIAKWSKGPVTPVRVFIARGGTASLTAYLLQAIMLSLIFCGYGFGLYAKPGAFICILIALIVGLISLAAVSLWRVTFKSGPMEYVLRRWTYLR